MITFSTKADEDDIRKIRLKSTKTGDAFHFADISFEDALKEDAFYMTSSFKNGRVRLVELGSGLIFERDDTHMVCPVDASMVVKQQPR